MSSDSVHPKITKTGGVVTPKFSYSSAGNTYPMGTYDMYRIFNSNFNDSNNSSIFFSSPLGFEFLKIILSTLKANLYIVGELGNELYLSTLTRSFEIIKLFFSNIASIGRHTEIFKKYVGIIPAINTKSLLDILKGTIVATFLMEITSILTSSTSLIVRSSSSIVSSQGSIESARNRVVVSACVDSINENFLSPVNPNIFDDFRQYCIRNIGEGTKVSEDGGHNLEVIKRNLFKAVGYFVNDLTFSAKVGSGKEKEYKPSFNSNSVENINNTLLVFLQNPKKMNVLIKIMKKMIQFTNSEERVELESSINQLEAIFEENVSFVCEKQTSTSSYIGGTSQRESLITRNITCKENIKEVLKSKKKKKVEESDSDSESSVERPLTKTKTIQVTKVLSSESKFPIEMNLIKYVMKILNAGSNCEVFKTVASKDEALTVYNTIIDDSFGDVKSSINLDWWQKLFIDKIKRKESFILVGDTSGGKTFISIMGIRILFNTYVGEQSSKFIYLAPTSQLAILQFANILTAYPTYSSYFGICCKSIVNIPSTTRILIGTPNEVKKYLYQVKFDRRTTVTLDNIKDTITHAVSNPFARSCKILFIDEIQTLSPTYVQTEEIEQIMECKAIEEIIKTVSYVADSECQVIGMSATLSPQSIENIKEKITGLTGIPSMSEIVYSHGDIGLSDLSLRETYVPIMKRPVIVPIKINGQLIESFTPTEPVEPQPLNSESIEMIVRDAISREVLPLSIYREDELKTIQMFKDFISYLERKNQSCPIWNQLYVQYNNEMDSFGYNKMKEIEKVRTWCGILTSAINSVIHNQSIDTVVHKGNFDELIKRYSDLSHNNISSREGLVYSPELYGLIVEYIAVHTGTSPFSKDIHPYYRFGVVRGDDFFNLVDPHTGGDSILKKLLLAQDADPSANSGSIIPLIMRGIRFGVGLITSSIPLGFQLEIFKFINIKSKQTGGAAPIPILFCEYGMSMGVNFSLMSVAILRNSLSTIGASEFKQIMGRAGRRGNSSGAAPVVYGFNISNIYTCTQLEVLDFDLSAINSNFFTPNEIYDYMCKIIVKYENNKEIIGQDNESLSENIIAGDSFKELGSNPLLVRKIQLAKYQIRELFNVCKNIFPKITEDIFRELYRYLQKAEFYNLNVQIS